ncbi:OLC1v1029006C1 [Oldenlandia corymbosa var. corymbosa]|uniref:OLC1v1029006C1 n=1 Tax=Oldenlandia corymbosa var. corymbosa TaxID=529605 RepID=A0AAV1CG67_OLDCO|nr:OLC1v1029006C1 [Oldenlandia corymbosa var. corymbosa]
MALLGDALRQAFMPKHEYESLREEDRAWHKLQRPLLSFSFGFVSISILICTVISLKIVFPSDPLSRPFCDDLRIQPLSINLTAASVGGGSGTGSGDSDLFPGAFYLTDQETVDYYWMVVFVPSSLVFLASVVYLVAGIVVAYSAPARHGCLKVVENDYCASRRGGVRCLSILNFVFAIIFGLLALFLGSTLLTLGSRCSLPLFWCYEVASWGLVILYGGTASLLRRKAAVVLDETDFAGRNIGVEMLEAYPLEVTPDLERRVNEGFKAWMGPSLLSSDDEDEPDDYLEAPNLSRTNSARQRV